MSLSNSVLNMSTTTQGQKFKGNITEIRHQRKLLLSRSGVFGVSKIGMSIEGQGNVTSLREAGDDSIKVDYFLKDGIVGSKQEN